MSLYYEDEYVQLHHGDARAIRGWLSADVLVTDPPYGMDFQSNMRKGARLERVAGDEDTAVRDAALSLWGDRKPAIVFGRWSVPAPSGERQRLIWHKAATPGMGDLKLPWGPAHEDIHLLGTGWDVTRTGHKRTGSVITTYGVRGGCARRGEHDRTPNAEACAAHGVDHRAVPVRGDSGPVRGFGWHSHRCPEPRPPHHRCGARGALLRDDRAASVAAGVRLLRIGVRRMSTVSFHAPGVPAPQGSKVRTRFGMRESSQRVKPWRDVVTQCAVIAADEAALLAPLTPPYEVEMWFYIPKPRTTRAQHPVAPTIGDLDKLVRAVGDALTKSGLIEDDRFIVGLSTSKQWAGPGEAPGAIIRVTEVTAL